MRSEEPEKHHVRERHVAGDRPTFYKPRQSRGTSTKELHGSMLSWSRVRSIGTEPCRQTAMTSKRLVANLRRGSAHIRWLRRRSKLRDSDETNSVNCGEGKDQLLGRLLKACIGTEEGRAEALLKRDSTAAGKLVTSCHQSYLTCGIIRGDGGDIPLPYRELRTSMILGRHCLSRTQREAHHGIALSRLMPDRAVLAMLPRLTRTNGQSILPFRGFPMLGWHRSWSVLEALGREPITTRCR
jgi:hypothetical protein